MSKPNHIPLIAAIVFATIVISGSVVFLGLQISKAPSDVASAEISQEALQQAIETYTQNARLAEATMPAGDVVPPSDNDHIYGDPDARITLIEFSDFECPYCKLFHSTPPELVTKYAGDVNWIYRHYPLDFHDPLATEQAIASECVADLAGDEAFWEYSELVFETTTSNGQGMESSQLVELAAQFDIDSAEFNTCINSEEVKTIVQEQIADGRAAGVSGTPGTIVYDNQTGDKILIEGAQPVEIFSSAIDQFLESEEES